MGWHIEPWAAVWVHRKLSADLRGTVEGHNGRVKPGGSAEAQKLAQLAAAEEALWSRGHRDAVHALRREAELMAVRERTAAQDRSLKRARRQVRRFDAELRERYPPRPTHPLG